MKGPKLDPPGGPLLISRGSAFLPFFPTSWCGVLVFDSVSHLLRLLARRLESFTHHLCHTIFHMQLCHTPPLCHTPSFTDNFVTHHLSPTIFDTPTLSPTLFHIHTPSLSHHLCHTPSLSHHLSHTTSSHTIFVTPSFTHNFVIYTITHRRGTCRHPPSFRVAGVALGDIHHRFAWQACHLWHWAPCTFVSHGKRGTWRHPPSFCVAGVALMALGWLWWRARARFGRQ